MMVIPADKNGITDSVYHTLNNRIDFGVPIVLVNWVQNFVFNDALLGLNDYVLICVCEYGWDFEIKESHIWGEVELPEQYSGEEWVKFDNWVKENPYKALFKRELLKKDFTGNIFPFEYPCLIYATEVDSEEKFNSRPINVFNYWGRSNEHRIRIHSEIWLHAFNKGFQPCDNIYYINNYLQEEQGEKWVSLWIPHYQRIDISNLINVNRLSKLCLSWAGSGFKCFRTSEAPTTSIMVMHKNKFAWTFDWNETNCILVDMGKEIEGIENALRRNDLYGIYQAGVENSKKYIVENYFKHLEGIVACL